MPPPIAPPLPVAINIPPGISTKRIETMAVNATKEASKCCERILANDAFERSKRIAISRYRHVRAISQEGPSCGLAALCMASGSLMENGKILQLKDVLDEARSKGYTSQGEMFSAANMATLAADQIDGSVTLLEDGLRDRSVIVGHLLRGNPVLVPYDADSNHEPCLRNGHKAHWAVLMGVVVCVPEEELANLEARLGVKLERDAQLANLYHVVDDPPTDVGKLSAGDIYVYARQGKSLHVHVWSYASLSASNENLFELSPKRKDSLETYTLPAGGVYDGLCHRAVLLEPSYSVRH